MKWYLIMVFICIFLIISDFEHHYRCLLAVCISSLEKCLVKSFAHFSLEVFWILLSCMYKSSLWSDINTLPDIWFVNIFSHSVGCFFTDKSVLWFIKVFFFFGWSLTFFFACAFRIISMLLPSIVIPVGFTVALCWAHKMNLEPFHLSGNSLII